MDNVERADEGYIYVASYSKKYYEFAMIAGESLRTFNRKAHITLYTHECWVDDRAREIFNNIVTGIPVHQRAKMWCMARTPYEKTFYSDVDSQVVHPRIKNVFDELGDEDMFFVMNYPHATADWKWAYIDKKHTVPVKYHGAVCCYKKSDLTIDFMQTWFDDFLKQRQIKWPHSDFAYQQWQQFDMFKLWQMTTPDMWPEYERFRELKIKLGSKAYGATIHDGVDHYNGVPPIVYQIESYSMETKMPSVWQKVMKGVNDERSSPDKSKTTKDSFEYL